MPDFYITYRLAGGTEEDVPDPIDEESAEVALDRFVNGDRRPLGMRVAWVWDNTERDGEALFTGTHPAELTAEDMPAGTRIAGPEGADFIITIGESRRKPIPQP